MRTKLVAVAVAVIALGATMTLSAPAHATTVEECRGLITDLAAASDTASSLEGRPGDNLAAKATAAGSKLDAGKVGDALAKLADYDRTLEALHHAAEPKVSEDDSASLDGAVHSAITCVENLGA